MALIVTDLYLILLVKFYANVHVIEYLKEVHEERDVWIWINIAMDMSMTFLTKLRINSLQLPPSFTAHQTSLE